MTGPGENSSRTLEPGMYLVGRHDGLVEPFFALVLEGCKTVRHHPDVSARVEQAHNEPTRWWWRRMRVCTLPDDEELSRLPPLYGTGELP